MRGNWRELVVAEGASLLSNTDRYPLDDNAFLESLEQKVHLTFIQATGSLTQPPLIRVFVKHLQLAAWPRERKVNLQPSTSLGYLELLEEYVRAYAACEVVCVCVCHRHLECMSSRICASHSGQFLYCRSVRLRLHTRVSECMCVRKKERETLFSFDIRGK